MKLKAQDLRIGNLIDTPDGIREIDDISTKRELGHSVGFKGFNVGYYLDVCKPIPITEEWLLKLGFEYNNFSLLYSNRKQSEYDIQILDDTFVIYKYGDEIVTLKYIHELQNLFYAITGNELEMKE